MQLGINDYHIYTRQDVQDLVRSFHYEENKDRYNKIYQELEEIKPRDPHGGLDQNLTKKEILDYMKHKMLCFYNPKIVGELFNLIGLDQNSTITRTEFCDYYLWFEEKTKEKIEILNKNNEELKLIKAHIQPDLSSKRNDYIFIGLRNFKTFFRNTSRWRGETYDISQLYLSFHHEQSQPDNTFIVYSMKDSRILNHFDSFQLSTAQNIALKIDMNQITTLDIRFFKRFNTVKRKQRDVLVASAKIRLDTNLILKNPQTQFLNVDLAETVDFDIEEALKAKVNIILHHSQKVFSNQGVLHQYFDLKYRTETFCCCYEYRSRTTRREYKEFKHNNFSEILSFQSFCDTYGPFPNRDQKVFEDIKELSNDFHDLKLEYDRKQITIPEALGTISFEMEVLRTEDMYLEMKRGSIESEELENIHEIMYLKGKLLHLHRLWGTLGVFDSVNFLKNFSVCKQGFIGSDHIVEWDSPLRNLKELDSFEEMGVFLKELFIWMPKFILLTTVLINFCRPDFLTVIAFLMIHPFLMFRWRMEHYYSAMFTVFCLIIFDVLWMALYYGDWLRAWYPVNWMDFVAMAWFLSLVNTLIKAFYIVVLAILAIKEHDKI